MMATHISCHNVVELLVKSGANLDLNNNGSTCCIFRQPYYNSYALLNAKASIDTQTNQDWTAIYITSAESQQFLLSGLLA